MAVFENRHTRRVAFLKVALPLLALAILSTLFLVADRRGTNQAVPFSQVEMDRMVGDQQVSGPNYTAVTEDGSALSITARSLTPGTGAGSRGAATDLIATLEDPGGTRLDLSSQGGELDTRSGEALLDGGVALRSTAGYRLDGQAFRIDATGDLVESRGAVSGRGPVGTLDAGQMTVTRRDGDYVLNFTGGVKLVYDPKAPNGE